MDKPLKFETILIESENREVSLQINRGDISSSTAKKLDLLFQNNIQRVKSIDIFGTDKSEWKIRRIISYMSRYFKELGVTRININLCYELSKYENYTKEEFSRVFGDNKVTAYARRSKDTDLKVDKDGLMVNYLDSDGNKVNKLFKLDNEEEIDS